MQQPIERLYFLDAMRAILMMLGVVIHSAQVYNPTHEWLIYSADTSIYLNYLVEFISVFRMPAFFVVSGFFCHLTLVRYRSKKFITVRLKRILVPLIITVFTLNSLQYYILVKMGWVDFDLAAYVKNGEYVSHLWFLINLVVYFIAASVIYFVVNFHCSNREIKMVASDASLFTLMFILPLFSIFILALNKIGVPLYEKYYGIIDVYVLMKYSPYFIFGCFLGFCKTVIDSICTLSLFKSIIFLSIILLLSELNVILLNGSNAVVSTYLNILMSWVLVFICFRLFYVFCSEPSDMFSFLSDASYTVYLFHHLVVIVLGLVLMQFTIPPLLGFFLLVVSSVSITLLVHRNLISKNKAFAFAFNGR